MAIMVESFLSALMYVVPTANALIVIVVGVSWNETFVKSSVFQFTSELISERLYRAVVATSTS